MGRRGGGHHSHHHHHSYHRSRYHRRHHNYNSLPIYLSPKEKHARIIILFITQILLFITICGAIIPIAVRSSIKIHKTITEDYLIEDQFPYQLYLDPQELGYLNARLINNNYDFYRCTTFTQTNVQTVNVSGDFVYQNYHQYLNFIYDGSFDVYVDYQLQNYENNQQIQQYFNRMISINNSQSNYHEFQFNQQDKSVCELLPDEIYKFSNIDEIFGFPKDQFYQDKLQKQSFQVEVLDDELPFGYVICTMVCAIFFMSCIILLSGLSWSCKSCCPICCCISKDVQDAIHQIEAQPIQQEQPKQEITITTEQNNQIIQSVSQPIESQSQQVFTL